MDLPVIFIICILIAIILFIYSISKDKSKELQDSSENANIEKKRDTKGNQNKSTTTIRKEAVDQPKGVKKKINDDKLDTILLSLSDSIKKLQLEKSKSDEIIGVIESLINSYLSPLLVTVLGEFSSGKSTFINALLRERLLAMKQRETTATITKLQFGAKRQVNVHYKDGRLESQELSTDNAKTIDTYIVEDEDNKILDVIKYVTIELENDLLKKIDIADTPGFNSGYNRHTELTKDFIRYSDLIIWLFDARRMGKASEVQILSEHCKHFKPIGVVNWVNKLELEDGETPEKRLAGSLKKYENLFEKFFFISALDGLNAVNGEYKKSGLSDVVDYFHSYIIPQATSRKDTAIIRRVRLIGNEILAEQQKLLTRQKEIKKQVDSYQKAYSEFEALQKKYNKSISNWNNDVEACSAEEILKKTERYFLVSGLSASLKNRLSEYLQTESELSNRGLQLEKKSKKIEFDRAVLNSEYNNYERRYAVYEQKSFKTFFDSLAESLVGSPLSTEKTEINQLSATYNSHSATFNSQVESYNRQIQQWNSDREQYWDSVTYFLNNVVLPALNAQAAIVEEKARELDKETPKIEGFKKEAAGIEKKIKIIHTEIHNQFGKLLNIVLNDRNIENLPNDLGSLLSQFDKYSGVDDTLDWSRIYTRVKMDEAIKSKTKKSAAAGSSNLNYASVEDRRAKKID